MTTIPDTIARYSDELGPDVDELTIREHDSEGDRTYTIIAQGSSRRVERSIGAGELAASPYPSDRIIELLQDMAAELAGDYDDEEGDR